jgi:hypothetical protein
MGRWLLTGMAVATIAACEPKTAETAAKVEGPRAVTVVSDQRALEHRCSLKIAGVDEEVGAVSGWGKGDCSDAEIREDATGDRIAFRYGRDGFWGVIHVVGDGRSVHDYEPPFKTAPQPRFEQLEPLSKSWRRIFDGYKGYPMPASAMATAIAAREGEGAAADFVMDLAAAPPPAEGDAAAFVDLARRLVGPDGGLAAGVRTKVLARLCVVLASAQTPGASYRLAAQVCPLDGDDVVRAAVQRARAGLTVAPTTELDTAALEWSAAIAVRAPGAAKELADAGCAVVAGDGATARDPRVRVALLVLAASRAPCPAVARRLVAEACDDDYRCGDAICQPGLLKREIADGLAPLGRPDARQLDVPAGAHLLLAAAHARGELPREFRTRNERATYEVLGPRCDDSPREICQLPFDGSFHPLGERCEARVDDRRHRIIERARAQ